jgi:hypothetical protein
MDDYGDLGRLDRINEGNSNNEGLLEALMGLFRPAQKWGWQSPEMQDQRAGERGGNFNALADLVAARDRRMEGDVASLRDANPEDVPSPGVENEAFEGPLAGSRDAETPFPLGRTGDTWDPQANPSLTGLTGRTMEPDRPSLPPVARGGQFRGRGSSASFAPPAQGPYIPEKGFAGEYIPRILKALQMNPQVPVDQPTNATAESLMAGPKKILSALQLNPQVPVDQPSRFVGLPSIGTPESRANVNAQLYPPQAAPSGVAQNGSFDLLALLDHIRRLGGIGTADAKLNVRKQLGID